MNRKKSSLRFDSWIFNSFQPTAEGLGLYRIFTALFILFFALPSTGIYSFLGNLPDDFFAPPPGPMMIFDGFPPEAILRVIHFALVVVLVSLFLGFFTKISSLSVGILLLTLTGFIYSIGKIDHFILASVLPLIMAFSGWGATYSIDQLRGESKPLAPQGWLLTLLALLIGFMFFTAGFPKILGGWLYLDSQATQGHYFKEFFVRGRHDLLAPYGQHIKSYGWEILDYATVIFEVGFLAAIFNPRSTRIFICLAVIFHFSTMLMLNISFLPNFVAYAAFINWSNIDALVKERGVLLRRLGRWRAPAAISLFMVLLYLLAWISGNIYPELLQSDWGTAGLCIVISALPVAINYLWHEGLALFK